MFTQCLGLPLPFASPSLQLSPNFSRPGASDANQNQPFCPHVVVILFLLPPGPLLLVPGLLFSLPLLFSLHPSSYQPGLLGWPSSIQHFFSLPRTLPATSGCSLPHTYSTPPFPDHPWSSHILILIHSPLTLGTCCPAKGRPRQPSDQLAAHNTVALVRQDNGSCVPERLLNQEL